MPAIEGIETPQSYTRLKQIAKGGMGSVELVAHTRGTFQRLLARKRLHGQLADDEEVQAMFVEEARLAGLIRHPNVVSVVDVGVDAEGPYLLMDYVEGITASELIKHSRARGEALPLSVVLGIIEQVARGLHAAHELEDARGPLHLIHRDVSPQNLLISFEGVVKVTDFGIAKVVGQSTRTSTGVLKGKLGYMAPEVLRFEPLDRRVDLFSLGVVLFELCTLSRLYGSGTDTSPGFRILNDAPPDLALFRDDVPASLVELTLSLLAKNASARPTTALVVADRVRDIAEQVHLVSEESEGDLPSYLRANYSEAAKEVNAELRSLVDNVPSSLVELAAAPKRRLPVALAFLSLLALVALVAILMTWSDEDPGSTAPDQSTEITPPDPDPDPVPAAVEVQPETESGVEEPAGTMDPESPPEDVRMGLRPRMTQPPTEPTEQNSGMGMTTDVRDRLHEQMDIDPWN